MAAWGSGLKNRLDSLITMCGPPVQGLAELIDSPYVQLHALTP